MKFYIIFFLIIISALCKAGRNNNVSPIDPKSARKSVSRKYYDSKLRNLAKQIKRRSHLSLEFGSNLKIAAQKKEAWEEKEAKDELTSRSRRLGVPQHSPKESYDAAVANLNDTAKEKEKADKDIRKCKRNLAKIVPFDDEKDTKSEAAAAELLTAIEQQRQRIRIQMPQRDAINRCVIL